MNKKLLLSLFALVGVSVCLSAADEARLLRFPATNGNEIVFSYAGCIECLSLEEKRSA
jgi:tricorn protease